MDKKIGTNMAWNSGGTVFYLGCQWLMTVLVVRLRGEFSDAGILTLAMSVSNVIFGLATLNLRTFQSAEVDERFSDGDYVRARVISCAAALAVCAAYVLAARLDAYTALCVISYILFRLSEAAADVFHGIDQKAWRLDIAGKSFIMRGLVTLAAFVVGETVFDSLFVSAALMAAGAFAVVLLYDVPACKKSTAADMSAASENILPLIKTGLPLSAYYILLNLIPNLPRFVLEGYHGKELLGVFGSVSAITVLLPQLASFIYVPLIPLFSEKHKAGDMAGFNALLKKCAAATALIGVLALLASKFIGKWALTLLFGEAIAPYAYLLLPIMLTALLTAFIWLLSSVLTVLGDIKMPAVLTAASALVCAAASWLLIKDSALMGTVLALGAALGVNLLLFALRLWRLLEKNDGVHDE